MSFSLSSPDLLDGLNAQQKKAVKTIDGKVLILAGAGSGKTRTLTVRMAYMAAHCGIAPENILGLTFTNKAAEEMRARIAALVDRKTAEAMTLCTFHSFCLQVLKKQGQHLGYGAKFTLYDDHDVMRIVQGIAREELLHEGELPSLADTMQVIKLARQKGLAPEEIPSQPNQWHDRFVRIVYGRLRQSLQAFNAMDFDSMLTLTVELFQKRGDILEAYQDRFRYVMIDEYQDTNPIQFQLTDLLTKKWGNLCVVGDDDQSIYGFRGADVGNILHFSGGEPIKLEQNYRSLNKILQAANSVIAKNLNRHPKALWSSKEENIPIEVFHAPDEEKEAEAVALRICRLRELHGLKWSDMAILYRSKTQSRQVEVALMRHTYIEHGHMQKGIPYHVFGGMEFYERKEVKDLLAYLKAIVNPYDEQALLRIINYPRRGISEKTLQALTGYQRGRKLKLWDVLKENDKLLLDITERGQRAVGAFIALMEHFRRQFESEAPSSVLPKLTEAIQLKKGIEDEVKSEKMRRMKIENIEEFISSLQDVPLGLQSLADVLCDIPLNAGWDRKKKSVLQDSVSLMTVHSSKGLEFEACFLLGLEEGILPHERSVIEAGGIEEERRLMYVALTRAKRFLVLSMAQKRKRHGKEIVSAPSRFVRDLPRNLLSITRWDNCSS